MHKLDGLLIANKIANNKDGKCLSIEYINNYSVLEFECNNRHKWYSSLGNIMRGKWCFKCFVNNRTLDGLTIARQIATNKGGICLSIKYNNIDEKLQWRCFCNNIWFASLYKVKNRKQWCPKCANMKRAKSQINSTILKHWKTGEELVCQASYEKRVVEYLNINKINFRWQSKTFNMPSGKTYRPDMYLFSDKKWIEIKGYFRKDAKEKWDWFHKEYTNSELWDKTKLKSMGVI